MARIEIIYHLSLFRSTNYHQQQQNNNSVSTHDSKPPSKADAMKSRIESFINHGEEDAEIADKYLDKKKAIKQQRSGTKISIGTIISNKVLVIGIF